LQGWLTLTPPSPATASLRAREPARRFDSETRRLVLREMWVMTSPLGSGFKFMKIPLCFVAACAAVFSFGDVPMAIDLSIAGDPTMPQSSQWTDTDWLLTGAALVVLGAFAIELCRFDDRFAGPVFGAAPAPAPTPEPPAGAALGGLVVAFGVSAAGSRYARRTSKGARR